MQEDIIQRFHAALPAIRGWINDYLASHAGQARAVGSLGFARLPACLPTELLGQAKIVLVPRVPFPPVESFGLPEFVPMQQMSFSGITFKDTFFVQEGQASESLCFHELIHVIQWRRLGVDNFLLAYGVGLLQFGYAESPLEKMAYTLQRNFDQGTAPQDIVRVVDGLTDSIWKQVAPVVQRPA